VRSQSSSEFMAVVELYPPSVISLAERELSIVVKDEAQWFRPDLCSGHKSNREYRV
jgi:hypothetical protein